MPEHDEYETAYIACLLAWADPSIVSVAHAGHACNAIGVDYLALVYQFAVLNGCHVDVARKSVADAICRAAAKLDRGALDVR